MKWNEELVKERLNANPDFMNLEREFEGKFVCSFYIDGVQIVLYNSVAGFAEVFFTFWQDDADIAGAKEFAAIAQKQLQTLINKHAKYSNI